MSIFFYSIFGSNIIWNLFKLGLYFITPYHVRQTDVMYFFGVYTMMGILTTITDLTQLHFLFENNYVNFVYSTFSIINAVKHLITVPLMNCLKDYTVIKPYTVATVINLIYISNLTYLCVFGTLLLILACAEISGVSKFSVDIKHFLNIFNHQNVFTEKPIQVEYGTICNICCDSTNIPWIKLKCNHVYHSKCISDWFKRHITCPYCRHNQGINIDRNCIVYLLRDGTVKINN